MAGSEAEATFTAFPGRLGELHPTVGVGGHEAVDPVAIARSLLLAGHGYVLSAHTMVDDEVSEADLDAELEHLVRRAIAP